MLARRLNWLIGLLVLFAVGWFAYRLFDTWRGIPDAYAAWDTGTLIIEYLKTHDDEWPRSWEDLDDSLNSLLDRGDRLRGSNGKGGFIYGELRRRVSIDWSADPHAIRRFDWSKPGQRLRVVTRFDGQDFPVTWARAEPNGMIWRYLNGHSPD